LPYNRGVNVFREDNEVKDKKSFGRFIAEKRKEKGLTQAEVAGALYVSDSHLMHLFKEDLGKTFNEYLTEYRIAQAKKMLRERKLRVYEVAYAVGYSDVKYFGQVFKKYVGCMPSEYAGEDL